MVEHIQMSQTSKQGFHLQYPKCQDSKKHFGNALKNTLQDAREKEGK